MSKEHNTKQSSKRKQSRKKQIRRCDAVVKSQGKPGELTHSAYHWMRKVKEGHFPPGNTNARKALDAIEIAIHKDFGPLNALQQIELNLLRPLLIWWILHPGITEKGDLSADFKWIHTRIESGLKRIAELADSKPPAKVPTIEEIRADYENEPDNHKSNK